MAALNANNSLAQASKAQQKGMQKLASGFKINSAADDASGLALVSQQSLASQQRIDISGLASGVYYMRIVTDGGLVTKPFVKK